MALSARNSSAVIGRESLLESNLRRVRRFWEKPTPTMARRLLADGCLWNSFVKVARVAAFLGLIRRTLPALDDAFRPIRAAVGTAAEADAAQDVYARRSPLDFSVEVLARNPVHLAVLPVTGINWTDLGQPRRVLAVLRALGFRPAWAVEPEAESA